MTIAKPPKDESQQKKEMLFKDTEDQTNDWLDEVYRRGQTVTDAEIKHRAKEFHLEEGGKDFKASDKWVKNVGPRHRTDSTLR